MKTKILMKKLFIFLFFCSLCFASFAQHSFSNENIEAFAKIYLIQKSKKTNFEKAYQNVAIEYNIDQEAWATLRNKQIENIPLSSNETNFLNAIQELKLEANRNAETMIQTLCVAECGFSRFHVRVDRFFSHRGGRRRIQVNHHFPSTSFPS